jgi:hypothetical protein
MSRQSDRKPSLLDLAVRKISRNEKVWIEENR